MSKVIPFKPGAAPVAKAPGAVRCILMVEDDPNDTELLQACLAEARREGSQILHARTLAEGLALQQAHEVDLTLLELDLPDSAGFHTLESMRAAAVGPVVVISGNGDPQLVEEMLKRHAYDVIPKHELDAATLRRVLRLATLHHEAGRALRATEGRFRALLENSAEALVLFDAAGRIQYASASMRRVLGYESAETVGRDGLSFVHGEDRPMVMDAFRALIENPGAAALRQVRFVHKDGSLRVLESELVNRLADADVAAITCIFRDRTREEAQRAHFDATFEHAPVGLAHVDAAGRIVLANRRLCEMLGYAREDLIGRTVRELSHPGDIDSTVAQRARLRKGAIPQFTTRKRYLRKDGAVLWVQLTVSLERDAQGAPLYDIAAFEDISASMHAGPRGERLSRMYAALSATNEAILKAADAQTLYRRVCGLLVEHGGLKLAAVRLVDPGTTWLETVAHAGEPESYLAGARISVDRDMPAALGPTAMAVLEGRTVVSNDYLAEPGLALWHASARSAGIAAMASVPLRRGGTAIGVISLYSAETGWFDPELVGLAEHMAENVSFALDGLDRDAALRESEARFRSLTEMSSDFYWETDAQHRFTKRGSGGRRSAVAAFRGDESIGKTRWELAYVKPDLAGWMAHKAVLEAHQPFRGFELSREGADGRECFVVISGDPVFDGAGSFTGYRGVGADITDRRVALRVLELEHETERCLAGADSALGGLRALMRSVCELQGWEQGRYWRVDDAAGVLRLEAFWRAPGAESDAMQAVLREATFAPGEGLAGTVWQSREPLWVADGQADPRVARKAQHGAALIGAFLFPVLAEGRVLGVFTFASGTIRQPDARLLNAVSVIGSQVGRFLLKKLGEESLRESEARFRGLSELSSDYYWETDAEHRMSVRTTGTRAIAQSTFGAGGGVGKRRWELPHRSPDMDGWMAHKAVLDAHEPFHGFEFSRPTVDGDERFFSITGAPVFDGDGRFKGYRGVGTDITERKLAERRLRLEHEVTRLLAGAPDAAAGLTGAFRIICETEGWDCGRYYEVDEKAGVLRYSHGWGVDDAEVRRFIEATAAYSHKPGEGVRGTVWQTGAPLWVADVRADPRVSERVRACVGEIRGAFVVPVSAGTKVIGVLSIAGRVVREPDERLLRTMGVIASQVGQFLQRKSSEQALRESEERFRSLTKLSSDWYWEQDAELRFTHTVIDDKLRGGISAAQHEGRRRWELPGTAPLSGDWAAHQSDLAARRPFRELILRRTGNEGELHYVSVSGEPVFGQDGEFGGYRGIAKDVTDSFRAVVALRESEERFRSLTKLSSDWYWEQDAELRFTHTVIDDKLRGGISAAQHEGRRRWELPGTAPLSGDWAAHQSDLAARRPFRELILRRTGNEGELHYVSVSGEPVFGQDGEFGGYRGIAKDVTDSFRAVVALRESEERFRSLTALSSDWYWEQDAQYRYTKTSIDPASSVFGDGANVLGKTRWELPLKPLNVSWELHREALEAHRTYRDFEYSYAGADGRPRYVSASGYPVFDAEGHFRGYRGIARDIAPRKLVEARLRVHAARQEAIAGFGQFALGRRSTDELYAEAARAMLGEGIDVVRLLEMRAEKGQYVVRACEGEGVPPSVGLIGTMAPDSAWRDILRENAPRVVGKDYLSTRPLDAPWRAWLRTMGSAVYVPVRDDEAPIAMLGIYAVREHAFSEDDVRFAQALGHVLSTALQRHKAEERLAHLAQFDALTGLPNRTLLEDRLGQSIVQSRRRNGHAGVLFMDLDRFKLVNDTLGHHQGDAMIRQVGTRLLACVRAGDTVGRISGDEFAVVLADMARPDDAALVAQKMLDALVAPFDLGGNEAFVTASIGIAAYPGDGDDAETLLKNADMAMYRAKEQSRNSYVFFTAELNQRSVAKMQLNADLRHALERGEFQLYYQPKLDLPSGQLRGLEALLRWNHPSRGLVPPMEFVPALEDSGLILPVGDWVIAEACAQVRRWELAGLTPVPVAVNLSAKQFLRRDLDGTITRALAAAGVPPRLLDLEITESCLMDKPEEAVRALGALREAGLKISVDDFGTGYSSLAYLVRFPLSALKIDRAFVRNVHLDSSAAAIVRAIIDMANNLGLQVVAEGVETEQQAGFLRRHGCHQGQGYLFGRPVPADEIAPRLRAGR